MSLATFKKKSINSSSSATKISGKPTNKYWLYQGPYGSNNSDTLATNIFKGSLVGPNGQLSNPYFSASNAGFSINGSHRNIGSVGQHMRMSKSATPFRGVYPKGWGGTGGQYPTSVSLNILPVITNQGTDSSVVKPSVLSQRGMLVRRFRWAYNGQYPNYWVQPIYTGNQTDTVSQGLYIHNKSAANDTFYDVNDSANYVDYYKSSGPTGCQTTPARGYTMNIQQSIAPYTKTLHKPKDSSAYTLFIQRRCQTPVGFQKPFPYAVQNGTGVLRGGIHVDNVASACNLAKPVLVPPDWYTGANIIKENGLPTNKEDQLIALRKKVLPELQAKVYRDVFLNGTTSS